MTYLIFDLFRLHRAALDRRAARVGLDRAQWWLIAFLIYFDGSTQQQLTTVMDMTKGGLAKVVDKLEKKGIVKRTPDHQDTRAKRVHLTAQGQHLAAEIENAIAEERQATNRALSADEQAVLLGLLTRMRNEVLRSEGLL